VANSSSSFAAVKSLPVIDLLDIAILFLSFLEYLDLKDIVSSSDYYFDFSAIAAGEKSYFYNLMSFVFESIEPESNLPCIKLSISSSLS
jgi:hypothetical protein